MNTPDQLADIYAVTPLQLGMLYHTLAEPEGSIYLQHYAITAHGPFDPERYARAWQVAVDRHPALRTSFHWEGHDRCLQAVSARVKLPVRLEDWSGGDGAGEDERLASLLAEDRRQTFNLERPPLLRLTIIRLAPQRHAVILALHHLIADGWSISTAFDEVAATYAALASGEPPDLPPVTPFRAYVQWLARQDVEAARAYWTGRLEGSIVSPLPRAHAAASAVNRTEDLQYSERVLDEAATRALTAAAQQAGLTLATLVQAAWALLLGRHEAQDRVMFGMTNASRPAAIPGIERIFGPLVAVLPCVVELDGDQPLGVWLKALQAEQLKAREHDYLAPAELQRAAGLGPNDGFLSSMVAIEDIPSAKAAAFQKDGVRFESLALYDRNNYPLTLFVYPGATITLRLAYDRRFLDPADADLLLRLAAGLLQDLPSDFKRPLDRVTLPPIGGAESLSGGPALGGDASLFARLATPSASRLLSSTGTLLATHEALLAHAERIDAALTAMGVADKEVIALLLDQGPDLLAAFLACLRRGSLSLQLDPLLPDEAVSERLAQAGIKTIVTRRAIPGPRTLHPDSLPQADIPAPRPGTDPDQAVILIMTSGSTGTPKLPALTQKAILNRLDWATRTIPPAPDERAILKTSPAFVDSIAEALQPLADGFDAIVPDPDEARTPSALLALIHRQAPTRLVLTPSFLRALIDLDDRPWPIRQLTLSGEPLPADLLKRLRPRLAPGAIVLNIYGSAEVTADVTAARLDLDNIASDMPIGTPLPGARIWLLDHNRRPVPPGAVGVMHVEGVCLAKGYHGDPALTRQSFHDWTTPDGEAVTLFDTGDLARRRPDGQLVHLGRRDAQIKLRGIRIEPAEIETRIRELPGVKAAVVTLHKDSQLNPRLVAYIQPEEAAPPDLAREVRDHLVARLQPALVPEHYVQIERWPLSSTGKILKQRLPAPPDLAAKAGRTPPVGPTEIRLAELWRKILKTEEAGREDDFFEAGGNSLLLTQLTFSIGRSFGIKLPMRTAFAAPVLHRIAAAIDGIIEGGGEDAAGEEQGDDHALIEQDQGIADAVVLQADAGKAVWPAGPATVFHSGDGGLVACWLLSRLLQDSDLHVIYLGSGPDRAAARAALLARWRDYGLPASERLDRVEILPGDLEQPRLGLDEATWDDLAERADVLIHAGARINFTERYSRLRAANVLGTREMLRLAVHRRTKPLHAIGSFGVIDATADITRIDEDTPVPSHRGLETGYRKSRWVADRMMARAIARGLPVHVYRMTPVSGDSRTGLADPGDVYWRLAHAMAALGATTELDREIHLLPVDLCIEAILALARNAGPEGQIRHVAGRETLTWRDVGEILGALGYPVRPVPAREWNELLRAYVEANPRNDHLTGLLPLIADEKIEQPHRIEVVADRTLAVLAGLGIELRSTSREQLAATYRFLIDKGIFPPPPGAS